ncbi:MAG: hypothetical protein ACT4OJ_16295 [Bacteroidota bacterium]
MKKYRLLPAFPARLSASKQATDGGKIPAYFNDNATVQAVSGGRNKWFSFISGNRLIIPKIIMGEIPLLPLICNVSHVE